MRHLGDFLCAATVRGYFNTTDPTTAAPVTLAGSPVVSVYKDGNVTQTVTGASLTVDFDAVTGLHAITIDTSADATFYTPGTEYHAVLTAGTVGGVSAAGAVIFSFSLQRVIAGILAQGTLDAGTASSFTIPASERSKITAGQAGLLIVSGAGIGQFKTIATYNSGTGVGAPGPTNFAVAPGTARFVVFSLAEASSDISSLTAQINTVQASATDIQSRIPTALVAGRIDASVGAVAAGAITNAAIANNAIDNNKLAAGAISNTTVADGTISALKIASAALSAAKLTADFREYVADGLLLRAQIGGSNGSAGQRVRDALAGGLFSFSISGGVMSVLNSDGSTAFTRTLTRQQLDAIIGAV